MRGKGGAKKGGTEKICRRGKGKVTRDNAVGFQRLKKMLARGRRPVQTRESYGNGFAYRIVNIIEWGKVKRKETAERRVKREGTMRGKFWNLFSSKKEEKSTEKGGGLGKEKSANSVHKVGRPDCAKGI